MTTAFLSSTYFGPVQWYQKLHRYTRCFIERHDSFVKQTYRNRCVIATANGVLPLTIPVERAHPAEGSGKASMRDIRISDHANWRHVHWNALVSAYGESPFFEYYADDLRPFYEKRWTYLFDFNLETTAKMCELLDLEPCILPTERFEKEVDGIDFRDAIHPKRPQTDPDFVPRSYYQVYRQRHGFLANMSILDLLFNEGNEAVLYL